MTDSYTLTNDQKKGAEAFFNFLMTDAKYFCLSGGAGVGKTFLMNHISNHIMQTYADACKLVGISQLYDTVEFTATTNKAAEVLEKSIGKPVSTIHSFLGLKVYENRKTGKTQLEKTNNYRVRSNMILFIDESSMIDTALFALIDEAFNDSKIIFVGDHAQMAPVGEEVSSIYSLVSEDNFIFLSEPVRNADSPPLMALCEQLRDTVETGEFHPMRSVPGSIEYLTIAQMEDKLEEHFTDPDGTARILCYTNSRVQDYNAYIRELQEKPDQFCVGDMLVVASTYASGSLTLNVEREVQVTKVNEEILDLGYSDLSKDGKPVQYRRISVRTPFSTNLDGIEVFTATEPDRLQHVLKRLRQQKRFSEYFDVKGMFLDLRDKHACTVYKSQGSTYETVFIDLGNIGTSWDAKQVARMLFVGVSRARSKVYFFGNLPSKYVGKQVA